MVSRLHISLVAGALSLGLVSTSLAATANVDDAAQVHDQARRVAPAPVERLSPTERLARELTELVNAYRVEHGLAPLTWNDQVAAAALAHSTDMAANARLEHDGTDGSDTGVRLERVGYGWSNWGENIGSGFLDPALLLDAWIGSGPHKQALDADQRELGVGVAVAANGVLYWTLVVATPA